MNKLKGGSSMSLDNLFNIVFPMKGCGKYDDVNHCAQSKANNLNCYTDQKTGASC